RGRARELPRRARRLLHLPGRHGRRLRGPARPDRVQARGACRDGRLGGDGVRVPRDRRPPGCVRRVDLGARAERRLRVGEGARAGTPPAAGAAVVDLASTPLRELNQRLHELAGDDPEPRRWRILNPNGAHAVACGLDALLEVEIAGHVGYYCAGMNKRATVHVEGNAGTGVAENMMSGTVVVE